MAYLEFSPCDRLAPFIARLWLWREPASGLEARRVMPDGRIELVINCGPPQRRRAAGGAAVEQPGAFVAGQLTRYLDLVRVDKIDVVGVRFRPDGFARLAGLPAHGLTDRDVVLGDLWGTELEDRVRCAAGWPERRRAIEAFFLRRVPGAAGRDATVAAALGRLDAGEVDVGALSASLGIGLRQLQRRFRAATGLAPKQYASVRRLQRVIRALALDPGRGLTELAHDAGFYDQPHFIHDMGRLAGVSPTALRGASPGEMSPFYNLTQPPRVASPRAGRPRT